MIVARQFIAWNRSNQEPVRRDGMIRHELLVITLDLRPPRPTNHTVPPGRTVFLDAFQAINCLATIIQSLRDKTTAAI